MWADHFGCFNYLHYRIMLLSQSASSYFTPGRPPSSLSMVSPLNLSPLNLSPVPSSIQAISNTNISSSSSSPTKLNYTYLYKPTLRFPSKPKTLSPNPHPKPHHRHISLATNLTAQNPEDSARSVEVNGVLDHARNLFDKLPLPVKNFPWAKMAESFLRLVVDLTIAVVKYLAIPVLAVSQLSEMSYCAHERKMVLVPIPFVVGFAVAGVLKDAGVELSSDIKEEDFPWHLLLNAIIFVLLKLPGPYYPYWGRLLIPHFANGGLWGSVWFAFLWYKRNQKSSPGDN